MIAPILVNLQQQPHRPWRFDSLLEAVKIIEDWRADYNANFYNTERRHSYLGNISPSEFETLWTSTYPIPQLA